MGFQVYIQCAVQNWQRCTVLCLQTCKDLLRSTRQQVREVRQPAAQSKLRSSAQGLLHLLCAGDVSQTEIRYFFYENQTNF